MILPMGRSTLKKANHDSTPIDAPTKYGDHRFICRYRTLHTSIWGRVSPHGAFGLLLLMQSCRGSDRLVVVASGIKWMSGGCRLNRTLGVPNQHSGENPRTGASKELSNPRKDRLMTRIRPLLLISACCTVFQCLVARANWHAGCQACWHRPLFSGPRERCQDSHPRNRCRPTRSASEGKPLPGTGRCPGRQ